MKETKICVIGLGYVGLPLARLFSTKYKTVGFDMNARRCEALMAGHDATLEVSDELLQDAINNHGFVCTSNIEDIKDCNFYVVAVPTPVDENNNPDLTPLYGASTTVGKVISKGDVVVYESTVYPGVTEDECIPVVEKVSGLKFNEDFFAGYSPERINLYKSIVPDYPAKMRIVHVADNRQQQLEKGNVVFANARNSDLLRAAFKLLLERMRSPEAPPVHRLIPYEIKYLQNI